jgi:hypothetical protein
MVFSDMEEIQEETMEIASEVQQLKIARVCISLV